MPFTLPSELMANIPTEYSQNLALGVRTVLVPHGLDGSHSTGPVPVPFQPHSNYLDGW
jgi:hypothetical protein